MDTSVESAQPTIGYEGVSSPNTTVTDEAEEATSPDVASIEPEKPIKSPLKRRKLATFEEFLSYLQLFLRILRGDIKSTY